MLICSLNCYFNKIHLLEACSWLLRRCTQGPTSCPNLYWYIGVPHARREGTNSGSPVFLFLSSFFFFFSPLPTKGRFLSTIALAALEQISWEYLPRMRKVLGSILSTKLGMMVYNHNATMGKMTAAWEVLRGESQCSIKFEG